MKKFIAILLIFCTVISTCVAYADYNEYTPNNDLPKKQGDGK